MNTRIKNAFVSLFAVLGAAVAALGVSLLVSAYPLSVVGLVGLAAWIGVYRALA